MIKKIFRDGQSHSWMLCVEVKALDSRSWTGRQRMLSFVRLMSQRTGKDRQIHSWMLCVEVYTLVSRFWTGRQRTLSFVRRMVALWSWSVLLLIVWNRYQIVQRGWSSNQRLQTVTVAQESVPEKLENSCWAREGTCGSVQRCLIFSLKTCSRLALFGTSLLADDDCFHLGSLPQHRWKLFRKSWLAYEALTCCPLGRLNVLQTLCRRGCHWSQDDVAFKVCIKDRI